jgi:hypothetical protein
MRLFLEPPPWDRREDDRRTDAQRWRWDAFVLAVGLWGLLWRAAQSRRRRHRHTKYHEFGIK